ESAAFLMEVVDVDDVLVLERRDAARFALEPNRKLRFQRDRGLERLDRHCPAERFLHGLIDDRHAPRADFFEDPAVSDAFDHDAGLYRIEVRSTVQLLLETIAFSNRYKNLTIALDSRDAGR